MPFNKFIITTRNLCKEISSLMGKIYDKFNIDTSKKKQKINLTNNESITLEQLENESNRLCENLENKIFEKEQNIISSIENKIDFLNHLINNNSDYEYNKYKETCDNIIGEIDSLYNQLTKPPDSLHKQINKIKEKVIKENKIFEKEQTIILFIENKIDLLNDLIKNFSDYEYNEYKETCNKIIRDIDSLYNQLTKPPDRLQEKIKKMKENEIKENKHREQI